MMTMAEYQKANAWPAEHTLFYTHFPPVAIEVTADYLKGIAIQKQAAWFRDPKSLKCKHAYGYALLDLAKETHNDNMREFANSLLGVKFNV